MPLLEGRGLVKRYGALEAVRGVDVTVRAGEFVAVLGRSGSGKSSLLAMLGGLSRPSEGRVLLDGQDLWELSEPARASLRGRSVGFMLQSAGLIPTLSALENVALPARLAGREAGAAELLARVGLGHRAQACPAELSGGEQRRVALARALVLQPPLLLVDEPTADLDEESEALVMAILRSECRERGAALVLVTHQPDLARGADRVLRVSRGTVGEEEAPAPVEVRVGSWEPAGAVPPRPAGSSRGAVGVLGLCLAMLAGDLGLARWQQDVLGARQDARKSLERSAYLRLAADLDSVEALPDGAYRVRVRLEHPYPESLYVMGPTLRAFVQVGTLWQEVPMEAAAPPRVQQVERNLYDFTLRPEVEGYEEVLPGYLHVRFTNTMLVSPRREPEGDVVEREDNYYVYLKPAGADDRELARRNCFNGPPPLWIPMPPH